jgi:hypothetical protein
MRNNSQQNMVAEIRDYLPITGSFIILLTLKDYTWFLIFQADGIDKPSDDQPAGSDSRQQGKHTLPATLSGHTPMPAWFYPASRCCAEEGNRSTTAQHAG